jgi:alpha-galactosidase
LGADATPIGEMQMSRFGASWAGAALWVMVAAVVSLALPQLASAEQKFTPRAANGLALTPPMGWNSWNKFGCDINEARIRAQADAMVASGMREAGYRYIVVDDCWQTAREAGGNIVVDAQRFPSGIRALADYVHARGLLFGIYSDVGDKTCQGRPGSRGHEYQDALSYAAWGVDYLKIDWCYADSQEPRSTYENVADALRASGRPIVLSICEWGTHKPWEWGASVGGNLWRTTGDIYDAWEGTAHDYEWHGVLDILDQQVGLEKFAGPGHWNDPDMLEVGNGHMTDAQYRAHFALWAMLAAPLMAGNDLSTMSVATRAILTHREIIAVDQDRLGIQGHREIRLGDTEVWVRPLEGGAQAVVLLNRGRQAQDVTLPWWALRREEGERLALRDLWQGRDLGVFAGRYSARVGATSAVVLRLAPAATAPTVAPAAHN